MVEQHVKLHRAFSGTVMDSTRGSPMLVYLFSRCVLCVQAVRAFLVHPRRHVNLFRYRDGLTDGVSARDTGVTAESNTGIELSVVFKSSKFWWVSESDLVSVLILLQLLCL